MPHRLIRMQRAGSGQRPVMLAIAGDSASGKTTLTQGLAQALGADRMTAICVDDYHRHNRRERSGQPFTALHPEANYIEIMEQHLQLLAMGQPVLKPVYDHDTGELIRPVLVEHCYECHSTQAEKLKGKLLLDSREAVLKGGESGAAIVPGISWAPLTLRSMPSRSRSGRVFVMKAWVTPVP